MMETYYAYLHWCRDFNEENLIDPTTDHMEWNHTLPQCLFKGHGPGQWLTVKQHAIASALQTLAFRRKCVCGWRKELVPIWLWEMCRPFFAGKFNPLTGKTFSDAHLESLREANKNPQRNKRISEKLTGRSLSDDHIASISASLQGRISPNKGKAIPENTKRKMSLNKLQRFQCLVTGFISSSTGLTKFQTRRNIDTSLRAKIN